MQTRPCYIVKRALRKTVTFQSIKSHYPCGISNADKILGTPPFSLGMLRWFCLPVPKLVALMGKSDWLRRCKLNTIIVHYFRIQLLIWQLLGIRPWKKYILLSDRCDITIFRFSLQNGNICYPLLHCTVESLPVWVEMGVLSLTSVFDRRWNLGNPGPWIYFSCGHYLGVKVSQCSQPLNHSSSNGCQIFHRGPLLLLQLANCCLLWPYVPMHTSLA